MKAKLFAAALLLAATPAHADLIAITVSGSGFVAEWTAETGCAACDYRSGGSIMGGTSPLLSASLTIGGQTIAFPTGAAYGVIYAYDDQSFDLANQRYSAFYINITVTPGSFAMNQSISFYSADLPGNLNSPFSLPVLPQDAANGSYSFAGHSGYLTPERVTLTNLSAVPVPGPAVGAGLPGLLMLFALWRRRRCARSC